MRIKLELDEETVERLIESAASERRPMMWQAEVLLRRALGVAPEQAEPHDQPREAVACER